LASEARVVSLVLKVEMVSWRDAMASILKGQYVAKTIYFCVYQLEKIHPLCIANDTMYVLLCSVAVQCSIYYTRYT
jgi:hypothetical protein